jgi:hypothetical protein
VRKALFFSMPEKHQNYLGRSLHGFSQALDPHATLWEPGQISKFFFKMDSEMGKPTFRGRKMLTLFRTALLCAISLSCADGFVLLHGIKPNFLQVSLRHRALPEPGQCVASTCNKWRGSMKGLVMMSSAEGKDGTLHGAASNYLNKVPHHLRGLAIRNVNPNQRKIERPKREYMGEPSAEDIMAEIADGEDELDEMDMTMQQLDDLEINVKGFDGVSTKRPLPLSPYTQDKHIIMYRNRESTCSRNALPVRLVAPLEKIRHFLKILATSKMFIAVPALTSALSLRRTNQSHACRAPPRYKINMMISLRANQSIIKRAILTKMLNAFMDPCGTHVFNALQVLLSVSLPGETRHELLPTH